MTDATFKIGDTVIWRGSWGRDAPAAAVIEAIDRCKYPRDKYGDPVDEMPWAEKEYAVVSLDNGHWAYGEQISPALSQEMEP